jgi:peptidoglycan-N-acetylglucosamine deacetylase
VKLFSYILLLLVLLISLGCSEKETLQPGICLSFDDNYIENWLDILPLLEQYNVHATFFLTGVGKLSEAELKGLKQIQDAGHAFGAHGEQHYSMNSFIKKHGLRTYWRNEIIANLEALHSRGIFPEVFAYPFGEKNWYIDLLLLTKFDMTRNVSVFKGNQKEIPDMFYDPASPKKKVASLGIDESGKLTGLELLMDKALAEGTVLLLHAHQVSNDNAPYHISLAELENILIMASEKGLRFYSYSDLVHHTK